jgi:hypothetical protein
MASGILLRICVPTPKYPAVGVTLGGPDEENKLFFFGDYQYTLG